MSFLPSDINAFNNDVTKWAVETKADVVAEMNALGIVHRENSKSEVPAQKAIKTSQRTRDGVVNKVSFRMPRHLVFIHKGKGRLRNDGTTTRQPKPWFNPIVEKKVEELAGIVAEHSGVLILNALVIK